MVAGCVGCLIDWVVCCVCAAASFAACYALANMMTCCLPACHCPSLCQCVQKPQGCGILRATFRSRFSSLLPSSSLCCCVLCFCLRCAPDCLFWLVLFRSVCVFMVASVSCGRFWPPLFANRFAPARTCTVSCAGCSGQFLSGLRFSSLLFSCGLLVAIFSCSDPTQRAQV